MWDRRRRSRCAGPRHAALGTSRDRRSVKAYAASFPLASTPRIRARTKSAMGVAKKQGRRRVGHVWLEAGGERGWTTSKENPVEVAILKEIRWLPVRGHSCSASVVLDETCRQSVLASFVGQLLERHSDGGLA